MWPGGENDSGLGRSSSGSEVVMMEERMLAFANASSPSQINVTGSNLVHVGPKFVSVNQTVHNREVVKGRFLGRELISPKKSNKLRCSIMVFVCWAVVVASGLSFYLVQYVFLQQTRLDLDLPLPKYLWSVLKSTTRAERLWCAAAIIFLSVCLSLIIVYVSNKGEKEIDHHDPEDWNISRIVWLAKPWENEETTEPFEPLRLVIIQHTVSTECYTFTNCAAEMRILQFYFINRFGYDIPYNFLIGNDGRVYEGLGWGIVGAHTLTYNRCALGIGFVGDYREEIAGHSTVTKLQIKRMQMLLDYGVSKGYLHPDYHILAARDIRSTASPGSNLYNEMRTWPHYNNGTNYVDKTCEEIYAEFKDG